MTVMGQAIDDIKKEILSKLNLEAEFSTFGINMIGTPTPKGLVKYPSPFNPDRFKAKGLCIGGRRSSNICKPCNKWLD